MSNQGRRVWAASVVVLAMSLCGIATLWAQGDKPKTRKETMRQKLAAAQDVLEGLTMDDLPLVAESAKKLKALSESADLRVHKDSMYQQHATEFQRIAEKMEKAANDKKADAASLAYVNLTLNCIECHRYVRDVLLAR